MQAPPVPADEATRLERLYRLDILDTPAEELYDDITRLAAMFCGTLFATVTLVDSDRQWFKARTGPLESLETPRNDSFCGHAITSNELFVIEDASKDERFHDNALVTGGPMIRFYAGAPLVTSDGLAMGTLCVFDPKPGTLDDRKKEALTLLAKQVTERLESRLSSTLASLVGRILDSSDMYVVMLDTRNDFVNYSNTAFRTRAGNFPRSARALVETLFPFLNYDNLVPRAGVGDQVREQFIQGDVCFSDRDHLATDLQLMTLVEQGRRMLLILFQDKSALRASQSEALKARSNLRVFSQLAVQSKNAVVITDHTGVIEWVNPSFEKISGYALDEIRGLRPGSFLQGPETAEHARERLRKHLQEARPVVQEILNYSKKGEPYWIELYIEPIRDEHGKLTHFVGSQNNVTQRKEQEAAVREARDAAERANRAKSQFLANISHELRTPLNGIMGVTELLQDHSEGHLKQYIDTLDHSSKHLLRLLNDILDLSHIESGHLRLRRETFALRPLLEELERLFSPSAEEAGTQLMLTMTGETGLGFEGDPTRLRQVLMNLVSNAIKFTHNGCVTLHAHCQTVTPGQGQVSLSVSDTGPGIPAGEQQRIFGRFEQLDNSSTRVHGGSGLGLAISRQIVRMMDSDIHLRSEPGEGSCFSFTLDLPISDTASAEDAPRIACEARELGLVLVVDDNEINRDIQSTMLRRLGARTVHTAGGGRRGLALIENLQPDLIIVDIQMPTMDGYEFLEKARAMFRDQGRALPVMVACTADTGEGQQQQALEAGFDAHLSKPVTSTNLLPLLTRLGFHNSHEGAAVSTGDSTETAILVDRARLLENFDNSDELLEQFLSLFQKHYPEHVERIQAALQDGDLAPAASSAHTLKGLLGYFGQPVMVDTANNLQIALAASDKHRSRSLFRALSASLLSLQEGLEKR